MAQDIFAPKTSFDIGYERPQEGVVDNTEKIKADFMTMALGAQAKSVQGQAMIENTQAGLLQSSISMAGDAYTIYSKGRERNIVDNLIRKIDEVEAKASYDGKMSFETRRSKYSNFIAEAANQLPGGYRDLAKYNAALKAKTGLDFTDIQKSTEATQFEAMQRDPKFMTAYLASKTLNPSYTLEQHATFAQNEAAESAAVELMATTASRDDIKSYYGKIKPALQKRVQNLNTAIIASLQLKRESGQPITTLDIESLEARVAEAKLLINMSIPNSVPEDERSNYSEYFQDLDNLLTQVKESKDPDKIATGMASFLAESERLGGGTMGDIIAGAKIVDTNILTTPQGLEIFKNITTKLSDGSSTAAISSKGDLGSIFDSLIEARQGEVIGPNTIMTQEELDVAFSTKGLKPEDLMTERATGLGLIKNLEVGDLATDKGKRQLVSGIASVVKSLNNLDLQQTGSKLNELVVDSGLIEKINMLDSYDKATANQIRTLLNSTITNNLRFSEAKIQSIEASGRGYTNRNPELVWDEAEQVYYATSKDYIREVGVGMPELMSMNMTSKGLRLPKGTDLAWGDIAKAYKHREVLDVANRILGQTKVEDTDTTMVDVGGVPTPERMDVLKFISSGEGGYESSNRGTSNNEIIGSTNKTVRGGKPLSKMTLGEIKGYQRIKDPNNPNRLFAVGAYQITPEAMDAAMKAAGVNDNTIFTADVQDRMGLGLLLGTKRPKLAAYIKGESDDINTAMLEFSKEFASVPDPSTGKSYYAGSGNKAQHTVAETREALQRAREAYASGIISEEIPRTGEMSNAQVIDTAEQAIESGVNPATSPRPQPRPTDTTQLNMISNADWLTPDLEKEMRDDGISIDSTPFFTSEKELENAITLGVVKVGQQVLLLVDDQPRYVKVTK